MAGTNGLLVKERDMALFSRANGKAEGEKKKEDKKEEDNYDDDEFDELQDKYDKLVLEHEHVKQLLAILNASLAERDKEIARLKDINDSNTSFLHTTIAKLIDKPAPVPPVSPAVQAYIEKKNTVAQTGKAP